jgi:hypothetical protein
VVEIWIYNFRNKPYNLLAMERSRLFVHPDEDPYLNHLKYQRKHRTNTQADSEYFLFPSLSHFLMISYPGENRNLFKRIGGLFKKKWRVKANHENELPENLYLRRPYMDSRMNLKHDIQEEAESSYDNYPNEMIVSPTQFGLNSVFTKTGLKNGERQ